MRNLILTGFMGTGKTTVGKILQGMLNMTLVDTDLMIEEREGTKISDIFDIHGEEYFRGLESDAIKAVADGENQIIVTGGGAIVNEDNYNLLKRAGKIVTLSASTDSIISRVAGNDERPLLNGKDLRVEIESLMNIRRKYYNKADLIVDTDEKTPEEVADTIKNYLETKQETVRVELGERSYDIKIGSGILSDTGTELSALGFDDRAVVISNDNIFKLYGDKLIKSLTDAGISVETILVEDGEKSKSLAVANDIITKMLKMRCERSTPLIALGGGVIGDLTGFVSSIYLRGVPFIQVPTTLLAQVDSSVGGKTGVNHELGKNLIGSFYQPRLVMMDTDVLSTLPDDEFLNGIAEIIKYGVISDKELFSYMINNADEILKKGEDSLEPLIHIIKRSCEIKADVVSKDEKESGLRAILNFGHTLGHALEATSSYKGIKHGKAVAIGMVFAAKLSAMKKLCSKEVVDDIISIIDQYGISTDIDLSNIDELINTMKLDKKVKGGNIKFVLPEEIGTILYGIDVNEDELVKLSTS
jgi:3-dehydroquinate synthase